MRNPYQEIKELLSLFDKEEKDILWIGAHDYRFYPPDLKTIFDFFYDDSHASKIEDELMIIYVSGGNWFITMDEEEREWQYYSRPSMPGRIVQAEKLTTFIEED